MNKFIKYLLLSDLKIKSNQLIHRIKKFDNLVENITFVLNIFFSKLSM